MRSEPPDEAVLRAAYEDHGRAVMTYAARLLQDREAAADVVQEAFLRAWRNAKILSQDAEYIRAWLLCVTKNIITDRFRATQIRVREVSDATIAFGDAGAAPDHADRVAAAVAVASALTSLSDDHREVLEQVYWKDRSVAEAAAHIGIPPGTVKSRTHNAVAALRKALGGRGDGW